MIKRALLILLIMTAALAGMLATRMILLQTGKLITLETVPVDPRSLFRGDYMRIAYAIGEVDSAVLDGDDLFSSNDAIYVVLEQGEQWWMPKSIHREKPVIDETKQVVIRGRIEHQRATLGSEGTTYRAVYGIETYFVPEGEGLELENRLGDGELVFHIAVDNSGTAAIHSLTSNGSQLYREGFF